MAYGALIHTPELDVLSLSPELFFRREGKHMSTRPMKGTAPRGRTPREDARLKTWLAMDEKQRAENLMIVDLLRNDLGKVSVPGSVRVSSLFDLERFETVWQMTSTVESTLRHGTMLVDLMGALFPCGSITGAPKIRTMQIIRELESLPRGAYTGAIGLLKPGGDCVFNVAIRTVVIDTETGVATFGVGGGVTIDSTAEREYEECLVKSRFLHSTPVEFQLLESMLLEGGSFFLLERHLARMKASAAYFGFCFPEGKIRSDLDKVAAGHPEESWKVRLLVSHTGEVRIESGARQNLSDRDVKVAFADKPVIAKNRFLFHKTTNRSVYDDALAARPDCDDVILWNEAGEETASTRISASCAASRTTETSSEIEKRSMPGIEATSSRTPSPATTKAGWIRWDGESSVSRTRPRSASRSTRARSGARSASTASTASASSRPVNGSLRRGRPSMRATTSPLSPGLAAIPSPLS